MYNIGSLGKKILFAGRLNEGTNLVLKGQCRYFDQGVQG